MKDYKNTLNLPRTSFAMKANLTQREPETIKTWEKIQAVAAMRAASGSKGFYVLHDGPPYANGNIHMGTALNKVLKDIIVKSRNMLGYACQYVPGWDCHGLPIEHKVEQELKAKGKELPPLAVRKLCREYAAKWIDIQRKEFIRLGVFADWDKPYLSMKPDYEAAIAANLAGFVQQGAVSRSKKAIYWCASCHTALAEAEVEYGDHESPSIYVAFPLEAQGFKKIFPDAPEQGNDVIIWTTTPWTIPDNMAICLHPDFDYVLMEEGGKRHLLAADRADECASVFGWNNPAVIGTAKGSELEGLTARHPIYNRPSPLILGNHVTLDAGTGCVHTAPGHGREDFEAGLKYGLEIYSPLDDSGRFLPEVEHFAGMSVWEANPAVISKLQENGSLLNAGKINHSYPHCWRCKRPVIFRATTQWFISMEVNDLRKRALKSIDEEVRWIPPWGRDRIYNMIESRPDWCISRQRLWGVPILALKCSKCGEAWTDASWMREICSRFAVHPTGCDFWYEADLQSLIPVGLKCPHCGAGEWEKETDILDVWFDSGSSFAAVLEAAPHLSFPADLYLEGSDQHRGWFHSSLLISEALRGRAPYREVLTHGYVVDGSGRKMSKSVGNVIAPQELIDKYGAEILRLWAASIDYREDIRISDQILERLVDAYRRIRNTCRFILGNIHDLPEDGVLPLEELQPLDRFALDAAATLHESISQAYLDFEFHKAFHGIHNYCITTLSAGYLDIIKDRLYASAPASKERRAAQTALWHILRLLLRDMAPILSFTAEEIFWKTPLGKPAATVFALQPIDVAEFKLTDAERQNWEFFIEARKLANRAIENLRSAGVIGHSLDAKVTLFGSGEVLQKLRDTGADLRAAFIVSQLELAPLSDAPEDAFQDPEVAGMAVGAARANGEKCARCWIYREDLGEDPAHPDLCPRCAKVIDILES